MSSTFFLLDFIYLGLLTESLTSFRTIEVKPFDNLVGNHIPTQMEQYLNQRMMSEFQSLKSSPKIEPYDEFLPQEGVPGTPAESALIFEGFIDDYDAGYAGLRMVELGFNHVAVTVRFQLRNKQTGEILAAASITAQDDRATATTKGAIDRITKRIHKLVNSGFGG